MKQVDLAYTLILFILVTLISCVEHVPAGPVGNVHPLNTEFQAVRDSLNETGFTYGANVAVIGMDGCEWIIWSGSHWSGSHHAVGWTHKGNCASCRKLQPCQ